MQAAKRVTYWCGCDADKVTLSGKARNCKKCGVKLRWINHKLKKINIPL